MQHNVPSTMRFRENPNGIFVFRGGFNKLALDEHFLDSGFGLYDMFYGNLHVVAIVLINFSARIISTVQMLFVSLVQLRPSVKKASRSENFCPSINEKNGRKHFEINNSKSMGPDEIYPKLLFKLRFKLVHALTKTLK